MEVLQIDRTDEPQRSGFRLRQECQERLDQLRQDVIQRPFLSVVLAFTGGLLAQTFPVRLLLMAIVKVISWLVGPAILALGAVKAFEIVTHQFGANFLETPRG
jgi:hypothetical protein